MEIIKCTVTVTHQEVWGLLQVPVTLSASNRNTVPGIPEVKGEGGFTRAALLADYCDCRHVCFPTCLHVYMFACGH